MTVEEGAIEDSSRASECSSQDDSWRSNSLSSGVAGQVHACSKFLTSSRFLYAEYNEITAMVVRIMVNGSDGWPEGPI